MASAPKASGSPGASSTSSRPTWFCTTARSPALARASDHIAIGPGGVFVIETKNYKGEVTVRGDDLFVAGRKRTQITEQTWREAVNVQAVLAEHMARLGLDVVPVLCIHGSAVPWKTVQRVRLVRTRGLKKLITKAKPVLSEEEVHMLAQLADAGLRQS